MPPILGASYAAEFGNIAKTDRNLNVLETGITSSGNRQV